MIDQTRLPREESYVTCTNYQQVAEAIRSMVIRGAPAIGVAAAMGIALGMQQAESAAEFETICETLARTRPTAVNLFWAIDRMRRVYSELHGRPLEEIRARLIAEAQQIRLEDIAINECIGRNGAPLIPDGKTVLTHCNAGALATAGYGTALGVIRAAVASGKKIDVFADETRPFLQGARLTVWELQHDQHPRHADHRQHGRPFPAFRPHRLRGGGRRPHRRQRRCRQQDRHLFASPSWPRRTAFRSMWPRRISTLDLSLPSGDQIPIEQRAPHEVTHVHGVPVAPEGTTVENPAFDVTPNRYVTAIITERGVARPPYLESLRKLVK